MNNTLNFGKYKNQDIKYIILTHIGYIMWCLENVKGFILNKEEQDLYDAIAILIVRDKISMTFPINVMCKHIKNRKALKELDTPFIQNNGFISFYTDTNNPICESESRKRKLRVYSFNGKTRSCGGEI